MSSSLTDAMQPTPENRKNSGGFQGNHAFGPALLDPDLPIPEGIVGPDGEPQQKRFSVYRNNVVVSLMDALDQSFPALKALVGEENFATLSRIYISKFPPQTAMLHFYGDRMGEFLNQFAPLAHAPWLADVARLESAWIEVHHEVDTKPLDTDALTFIHEDRLLDTVFIPHPATRLIPSDFALLDLYHYHIHGGDYPDATQWCQTALLCRPALDTAIYGLNPIQTCFFKALLNQQSLGESYDRALQLDPEFDLAQAIGLTLSSGMTSTITTNQ